MGRESLCSDGLLVVETFLKMEAPEAFLAESLSPSIVAYCGFKGLSLAARSLLRLDDSCKLPEQELSQKPLLPTVVIASAFSCAC